MRIVHVLDHGLPMHSGYTFRTRAIVKAQQALGWEVVCLTGTRHTLAGPNPEIVDGITFYRTTRGITRPSPLREWREIDALARRLDALVTAFGPDLIHAHSPVLNAISAQRVARRRKLPMMYEIRAFWEDAAVGNGTGRAGSPRYRVTRMLETRAARRADKVAVICEGLRDDLIARGIAADKIIVSPNGVDMALFGTPLAPNAALARELGLEGTEMVGFIGSFYDYEGIDDLIAAMPALIAKRPAAQLLLVGGGPVEAALKAQAAASRAADRIRFVGRVPHDEVERYYSLIDILAYPRKAMRLTELVTPLKPLEAMAQMKLVAASDVGGHRELIADGVTGTLFAPGDPAAIAAALDGLFSNRDGWDDRRAAARSFVERDRNWSSNISRYAPAYQEITARTRNMADRGKAATSRGSSPDTAMAAFAGAAAGFAAWAMPAEIFPLAIAADPAGGARIAAAATVAALTFFLVAALLRALGRLPGTKRRRRADPPKLRRADAHPDAPSRWPVFAGAELGDPIPVEQPASPDPATVEPEPVLELVDEAPADEPITWDAEPAEQPIAPDDEPAEPIIEPASERDSDVGANPEIEAVSAAPAVEVDEMGEPRANEPAPAPIEAAPAASSKPMPLRFVPADFTPEDAPPASAPEPIEALAARLPIGPAAPQGDPAALVDRLEVGLGRSDRARWLTGSEPEPAETPSEDRLRSAIGRLRGMARKS